MVSPGQVAAAIGVGLAAGLAGTAAMTVSSTNTGRLHRDPAAVPVGLHTWPALAPKADFQDVGKAASGSTEPDFHPGL